MDYRQITNADKNGQIVALVIQEHYPKPHQSETYSKRLGKPALWENGSWRDLAGKPIHANVIGIES